MCFETSVRLPLAAKPCKELFASIAPHSLAPLVLQPPCKTNSPCAASCFCPTGTNACDKGGICKVCGWG